MSKEEDEVLFKQRLEFISNKDNAEEMETLKKNYTFHALKFEEGMDRWFDLWRRNKKCGKKIVKKETP